MLKTLLIAGLVLGSGSGLGSSAFADDAEVSTNGSKPAAGQDADDVLTNNFLRAYSGSKSPLSLAFTLNYSGATVSTPFDQNRPNIAASSATTLKNDFDGTFSVKYALTNFDSVLLGFGARWLAPFVSGTPSANGDGTPFNAQRVDAYNPSLTYQHIYKAGPVQCVAQLSFLQWTQSDYTPSGYAQQYSFDQENIIEIGSTGLSVGGSVSAAVNTFYFDDTNGAADQSVYQLNVSPYTEYSLTEKVNLRAVLNPWSFEHYRYFVDQYALIRDITTVSLGVGFSVTRDIFIYPNVQFLPDRPRTDLTNVAVYATINLF